MDTTPISKMNNLKYKIPIIGKIIRNRDILLNKLSQIKNYLPTYENFNPGHFYSVIPDLNEIKKKENKIFSKSKKIVGINLNETRQINLLDKLSKFYKDLDFPINKIINKRYYYNNPNYGYGDAIILYSIIRHFRPKRIIEIGSGFSSCVTLDTNQKFFKNKIKCTFIEPYSELLKSLIKKSDKSKIIESNLQDISIKYFKSLKQNDILFIDSTHVSKVGSDVNFIIFELLPILNPGVIIHIHDVFDNFEYPKEWIYRGFFWNEDYLLRAFLEFNNKFEIIYFNNFMYEHYRKLIQTKMPLILNNAGGGIWLKKL